MAAITSDANAARAKKDGDKKPRSPHFPLVDEFFRNLLVAEKNFALYPIFGSVAQGSLQNFVRSTRKVLEEVDVLRLVISNESIEFEDDVVYHESNKGQSIAFRLYKDGIREILFLSDVADEELQDLLLCLKDARKIEDEDDDFITLFWEKDCSGIKIHLADDFLTDENIPQMPTSRPPSLAFHEERFLIPDDEKERLEDLLESRCSDQDEGDDSFELDDEERAALKQLVDSEQAYFPMFDFLDILLELMVRKPDASSFDKSVKMIRSVIDAMVDDRDFTRASVLLRKFACNSHPSLSERQRSALREMAASFNDKKTLSILQEYLEEHSSLRPSHPVFDFMRSFPKAAAEDFCGFLGIGNHLKSICEVLVHLGTGKADLFANMLGDPDPLVVKAMIGILLRTDEEKSLARIARALSHPDESVKVHAANTILENGDESAGQFFIPLLGEPSKQLLNLALKFFSKYPVPEAFGALVTLSASKRFRLLDMKRQETSFRALLTASPSRGVEYLRDKVLRWGFCFGEHARVKKTAALNSLVYCDTDEALALLARFATRKRGLLPAAARRSMKRWEQLAQSKVKSAQSAPSNKKSEREVSHV